MTNETATFNIEEFELRGYTNPYLSPDQQTEVTQVEDRVNSQLDFVAQMLGWNGPNYWTNLPSTVNQKRQVLGGTFGVYNSYVIPKVYEIRNWDSTIVVDKLQFLVPGRQTQVARIVVGNDTYQIESVSVEGDRYVISIGPLSEAFFDQIANNVPIQVDIPTYRPAPFYRPSVGIAGDYSFRCEKIGSEMTLYPAYDTGGKFPFKSTVVFAGGTYYFDQPVYLSTDPVTLDPLIVPSYDSDQNLWYFEIGDTLSSPSGIPGWFVWANSDTVQLNNAKTSILIQPWIDPSDWNNPNVINNFRGTWGNKGGDLPYNFVFDSLSIHGFNEAESVYLPPVERKLNFNEIVNFIYYQRTYISDVAPKGLNPGDLWWNDNTGALAVWLPNGNCGAWVEIDYRQQPRQSPVPVVTYADVTSFRALSPALPLGTIVQIMDVTGLTISDNVIGVQGTLLAPGSLILHRDTDEPYWTPDEFIYLTTPNFEVDAPRLPYKVPVTLSNASGLGSSNASYNVSNLGITISNDYEVLLIKYYNNKTWEVYPDSLLKYIAYSALFGGPLEGEMWWDFVNTDYTTRAAAIYYDDTWVSVNKQLQSGPPSPPLDLGVVLFYCNGSLLSDGVTYVDEDRFVTYTSDPVTGSYEVVYVPRTFKGSVELPSITISDNLTTTYRADITDLIFGGITYYMSPNVYNAETPLRLWKAQDLQVAETVAHLAEDNYINPLLADLNNGPGPENWEKYFVRLPLEYGRNEEVWQKVALTCQDFGYWGSSIDPEVMRCPPEDDTPVIYEELFLYDEPISDYTYVYCEPYLYSNIAYPNTLEPGVFRNAGIFPASDVQFDEFDEAEFITYDPLHDRQADVTSPVNQGYGDWLGDYVNINPCVPLTGFLVEDLVRGGVTPVAPPVWDASIYKFAPTCENTPASYNVDANHYKIGYAYFVADASAAEDAFFDISQEAAWRYPVTQPKTLYLTPR